MTTPAAEKFTKPTKAKKSKHEDIDLELTSFWRKEIDGHEYDFRDSAKELEVAKAKLDAADKEYRDVLRVYNLRLNEALSICTDVVLNRLPIAERRFLIKEIASVARFFSGQGDIVISRQELMRFVESLVFYGM